MIVGKYLIDSQLLPAAASRMSETVSGSAEVFVQQVFLTAQLFSGPGLVGGPVGQRRCGVKRAGWDQRSDMAPALPETPNCH